MSNAYSFTKPQIKSIVNRYSKKFESAASIANDYGVSTPTILRLLRNEGVDIRPRGPVPAS
jgi:hypothetical protein